MHIHILTYLKARPIVKNTTPRYGVLQVTNDKQIIAIKGTPTP
jgi:hypothetical protein